MGDQFQSIDHAKATAIDMALQFGPKLLTAAIIVFVGYLAARWAGHGVRRLMERFRLEPPVRALLEHTVQIIVLVLFAIMAMQNLGVQLLPLVAGLGVAGAGVALALQGVLGNIVSGLTIIFTQPFHVGDYISISNEEGEVLDVSLFSTTLGHPDRSHVVIPNRKIVGEILHNFGKMRRLDLSVGIAHDGALDAALRVIDEVLRASPLVLQDPAPVVGVVRLADATISIAIRPWVAVVDYETAIGEINRTVLEQLREQGIPIALPQRVVRMLAA